MPIYTMKILPKFQIKTCGVHKQESGILLFFIVKENRGILWFSHRGVTIINLSIILSQKAHINLLLYNVCIILYIYLLFEGARSSEKIELLKLSHEANVSTSQVPHIRLEAPTTYNVHMQITTFVSCQIGSCRCSNMFFSFPNALQYLEVVSLLFRKTLDP